MRYLKVRIHKLTLFRDTQENYYYFEKKNLRENMPCTFAEQ